MVQEPSFFTFAGHDVRRLRSRSVAVMDSLSPPASNRKLERIGMVVLRSTTPCVAVSSFNRSFLLTLISIVVPTSIPVAEGIKCGPLNILLRVRHSQRRDVACYVSLDPYSLQNTANSTQNGGSTAAKCRPDLHSRLPF